MKPFYDPAFFKKPAFPFVALTEELLACAEALAEASIAWNAAGLAAHHIGELFPVIVIRYGVDLADGSPSMLPSPRVIIDPQLSRPSLQRLVAEEGSVALPGITKEISRPHSIQLDSLDREGKKRRERLYGWQARVVMHETDQLKGHFFLEDMGS
ncbi:MAG: peptide deformylase [Chlamydiota bacterium]|nr:peptide deformylase [Chlamydiota bacterium]